MKKLFALLTTLLVSLSIHAAQFEEGKYYKVLDRPHSENPKVMEFFSFYCPHCHEFEPIVEQLAAQLPAGTEFQRVHVSFMGGPYQENSGGSMLAHTEGCEGNLLVET